MSDRAIETYRKKPVEVEAMRVTADNPKDVCDWINRHRTGALKIGYDHAGAILIQTLEGVMRANVGDYVICGAKGEFYPCRPDIFRATYEPAEGT